MKNPKRMKGLAKSYPNNKEFYATSDGHVFLKEGAAKSHAATLEDKEVTTITRAEINALPSDKKLEAEQKAADKKAAEEKEAADKKAAEEKKAADKKAADKKNTGASSGK